MASRKNTKSLDNNLFDTNQNSEITETPEVLLEKLKEIELLISEGNISISEQIQKLEEANLIIKKVEKLLSEAKAKIEIIEAE